MRTTAQVLTLDFSNSSLRAGDVALHTASELSTTLGLALAANLKGNLELESKDVWATLDSGASLGLISESEALNLNATVIPSPIAYSLSTANGLVNASNLASLKFPALDHTVTPIILDNSHSALVLVS
jgi:hypothetical protein